MKGTYKKNEGNRRTINVNTEKSSIIKAIKKGLSLNGDPKFINKLKNPYGDGFASLRSHEIFKKII